MIGEFKQIRILSLKSLIDAYLLVEYKVKTLVGAPIKI